MCLRKAFSFTQPTVFVKSTMSPGLTTDSWYRCLINHCWTWILNNGHAMKETDHILVKNCSIVKSHSVFFNTQTVKDYIWTHSDDREIIWSSICNAISQATNETIGFRWSPKVPLDTLAKNAEAHKQRDAQEHKWLKAILQAMAKHYHEIYISTLIDEAEDSLVYNNLYLACRAIACLVGSHKQPSHIPIRCHQWTRSWTDGKHTMRMC